MKSGSGGMLRLSLVILVLGVWPVHAAQSAQNPVRIDFSRDVQPATQTALYRVPRSFKHPRATLTRLVWLWWHRNKPAQLRPAPLHLRVQSTFS
ncbi:MAG: hypothetical protein ABI882_17155 [Acidobacteriota bacterium]